MFMKVIAAVSMILTMLLPATIHAQESSQYVIRFRTADGSRTAASSITLSAQGDGELPELKTDDDYRFRGWALQADFEEPSPSNTSAPSDSTESDLKKRTESNRKAAENNRLSSWSSKENSEESQTDTDDVPQLSDQTASSLVLSGSIRNYMVESDTQTVSIRSFMPASKTLTLYARWTPVQKTDTASENASDEEKNQAGTNSSEDSESASESRKTAVLENAPASDQTVDPPSDDPMVLPETDREGTVTDIPYTIHFTMEDRAVKDLVFYEGSVKNVPEPESADESFLGWKIVNPKAKSEIQGGFNPENDILLSHGQISVQTVDFANPAKPRIATGVTTLTPFYDENRELTLEAVYEEDLPQTVSDSQPEYMTEAANAAAAYATFNTSTGSLDFYWGTAPSSTSTLKVMTFNLYQTTGSSWPWEQYASQVKTATFHNNYTPYTVGGWFMNCSKMTSVTGLNLLHWTNVNNATEMFANCSSLTSLDVSSFQPSKVTNFASMFNNCSSLTTLDVSGWDTSSGQLFNGMFMGCTSLQSVDVSNFKMGNATAIPMMFRNCAALTNLDVSKWDVSNNLNAFGIFSGCSSLTALNVASWNMPKNTSLFMTFMGCSNLVLSGYENWDVSNVTTLNRTFTDIKNDVLNLNNWNTSKHTSLEWTFGGTEASSIEISDWDTSNVTTMLSMCADAPNLTDFNCATWKTGAVTTMEDAFRYATSLSTLPVSSWDTHSNTSLYQTFQNATSLTDLDVSGWNTSNVTTLYCTFNAASVLPVLDASNWDTSKVTNMRWTFGQMNGLTQLDLTDWNTDSVQGMDHMFYQCPSLQTLKMGGTQAWNTKNVTSELDMFNEDPSLSTVILSPNFTFQCNSSAADYGLLMSAPNSALGIEGAPDEMYGNWYCTDAADGNRYAGSPAELQAAYDGTTMAGTWTWAKGAKFDVTVNLEGNAKVVPDSLTAALTVPVNFMNLQSREDIIPAELTLARNTDNTIDNVAYTGTAYGYNTSEMYAPSVSGVPEKYEFLGSTGAVSEPTAYTMNSDTGNAVYNYQYYLPVALPATGQTGVLLAGTAGLAAIIAGAWEAARRKK